MFDSHRAAIELAKLPYVRLAATKGYTGSCVVTVAEQDYTGETLECVVSDRPGGTVYATLSVSIDTEQKTWQDYVDMCVPLHYVPCDVSLTDTITSTLLTISWGVSDFTSVPSPTEAGEPVDLYMEVRRTTGASDLFLAGDFILTESNA